MFNFDSEYQAKPCWTIKTIESVFTNVFDRYFIFSTIRKKRKIRALRIYLYSNDVVMFPSENDLNRNHFPCNEEGNK